jgi:hypothetical protein
MLFVPSIGGTSHHWREDTKEADIVLGCQVMATAAARRSCEAEGIVRAQILNTCFDREPARNEPQKSRKINVAEIYEADSQPKYSISL